MRADSSPAEINIGDVLRLDEQALDDVPVTLEGSWREVTNAVYKLEKQLLVILDIHTLLSRVRQKSNSKFEVAA